jgi:hypothetical protein
MNFLFIIDDNKKLLYKYMKVRRGSDRMVVGVTTTCAISACASCRKLTIIHSVLSYTFMVMVFDATYNNISVISWRSVLLV